MPDKANVTEPAAAPVAAESPSSRRRSPRMRALLGRELTLVPALLVAVVVGVAVSPAFLSQRNLVNLLQQSSELAIVVVALSLVLISGKFDLSLESTFGLAPMVGAWLYLGSSLGGSGMHAPVWLAILGTLVVGLIVGAINGLLVVKLGLNAFIVTLAMLILLRGVDLGLVSGRTLFELPDGFLFLGTATFAGIPVSVWTAALVFVVGGLFLKYHRIGRSIYAIGGNADAARAAGIDVQRIRWGVFAAAGVLAAIAGLALAGRTASVTPSQGQNLIFSAFAAAVIGGVSLNGGQGTMFGAFLGVLLLAVIGNILTLSQVPSFWIDATNGAIILVAILISRVTRGREEQ